VSSVSSAQVCHVVVIANGSHIYPTHCVHHVDTSDGRLLALQKSRHRPWLAEIARYGILAIRDEEMQPATHQGPFYTDPGATAPSKSLTPLTLQLQRVFARASTLMSAMARKVPLTSTRFHPGRGGRLLSHSGVCSAGAVLPREIPGSRPLILLCCSMIRHEVPMFFVPSVKTT